tara:strand:+ start:24 stop:452 length:429 start_codon:yes stop_codon:yes gene_type:complete
MYSKKVLTRFENPKHVKAMANPSSTGQVGNPACGDVMKIFLKIKDNQIIDASVQTYGCVAAIAASDALCEIVIGKTIAEAEALTFQDVLNVLGEVPQLKVHCSQLGISALKKAINEYKTGNSEDQKCKTCPGYNKLKEKSNA